MESSAQVPSESVKHDQQLVVRLPAELLERVDTYVREMHERTGLTVTRADAVRKLLSDALDAAKVTAGEGSSGKRKGRR